MGVCNRQPLVKGKGVHREVESEGSSRQISAPRNTNHIRHNRWDEIATQIKIQRLHRHRNVNMAEGWKESVLSYHGRSHGHVDVFFSEAWSKASHEKSADAIVL
jgi:hypothetical protein